MIMRKKIITMGILLVGLLLAVVIGSLAWFTANKEVYVDEVTVTSSDRMSISVAIPDYQLQPDAYIGQTGIEYDGYDSPYYLLYEPVLVSSTTAAGDDRYLQCNFSAATIQTAIESQPLQVLSPESIKNNFTWRLQLTTINYASVETRTFRPENGFLCDVDTGEYLGINPSMYYHFRLYIYFLGETGYNLLTTTRQDISNIYTFDFSDEIYMWATFNITVKISIGSLNTVSFNGNGGSSCEPISTSGAGVLSLPTPTHPNPRYTFLGWYDNEEFLGEPYTSTTLVTSPKPGSFTLYARWDVGAQFTYNYNGVTIAGANSSVIYPDNGSTVENRALGRQGNKEFYCWTTTPLSYQALVNTPSNSQYIYDFSSPVTVDTTVYAVWREYYTVTFTIPQYTSINTVLYHGTLTVDGTDYTDTYSASVLEGNDLIAFASLIPTGNRTFKWWAGEKGNSSAPAYDLTQLVFGNVNLYAYYRAF